MRQRPMLNDAFKEKAQAKIDEDERTRKEAFADIVDRIKKEDEEREHANK